MAKNDQNLATSDLEQRYNKLSTIEKEIVGLLAVIRKSGSRTWMIKYLSKARIKHTSGQNFTVATLNPYLEMLQKKGFILWYGSRLEFCKDFGDGLTRILIDSNKYKRFADVVLDQSTGTDGNIIFYYTDFDYKIALRDLMIRLTLKDLSGFSKLLDGIYKKFLRPVKEFPPAVFLFQNLYDFSIIEILPSQMIEDILEHILNFSFINLEPAERAFEELSKRSERGLLSRSGTETLIRQLILRGNLAKALNLATRNDAGRAFFGWIEFLKGDEKLAISKFTALASSSSGNQEQTIFLDGFQALFFILALIKSNKPDLLNKALIYIGSLVLSPMLNEFLPLFRTLKEVILVRVGRVTKIPRHCSINNEKFHFENFFSLLAAYWFGVKDLDEALLDLEKYFTSAVASGYLWYASELAELINRISENHIALGRMSAAFREREGVTSIVDTVPVIQNWELSLQALLNMGKTGDSEEGPKSLERLVWFLSITSLGCNFHPKIQKFSKGRWTKGRTVALKRLYLNEENLSFLTPQDFGVCESIESSHHEDISYSLNGNKALLAFVGHPLVFNETEPEVRVEVIESEPELIVSETSQMLRLRLEPQISEQGIYFVLENPSLLKVFNVSEEQWKLADIIGEELTLPISAKETVLEAICGLSSVVTLQSAIGFEDKGAEKISADSLPYFQLYPFGEGLKVRVVVRPFGLKGSCYVPASGTKTLVSKIGTQVFQTDRNMKEEKSRFEEVIRACKSLEFFERLGSDWNSPEPEHCLELLTELEVLGDRVRIEWPQGERLKIAQRLSVSQLSLTVQKQGDCFEASGEFSNGDDIIDMSSVLKLLDQTQGRFLPLGDGQFIELTRRFRQRLDELRAFSEPTEKGLRFHPSAALSLNEFSADTGTLTVDGHWQSHVSHFSEAQLIEPKLPSTFKGQLRDYQAEGFVWMARLAHWGAGACLADDMGLGKTIQVLALLLYRASKGPSLVIAPTWACSNWIDEARRFTPTLNPILFGKSYCQDAISKLGPFDVLVCSYGLMVQEVALFSGTEWNVIVLDEAQAIKNSGTKRSGVVMSLRGAFKLITTGTPVENHLGEFWNLFCFINPGLLGSLTSFNRRFMTPIEKEGDTLALGRLRKLVQPFVLRRLKSQVFDELPTRTEILMPIPMTSKEMALYEALRQSSISKVKKSSESGGKLATQILAELMTLRRMCCNSQLILPENPLPSSKMAAFERLLEELLAGGHKTLVFSQFIDNLSIIREFLESKKIDYRYLDGSTSQAKRKQQVDAFQAGEGNLFLINLKAVVTGLNLTAADYVIHMDPWWNPAVEDQASGRAHRIGQLFPVTVYRLVAKHTIEEKIVELCKQKGEFAKHILEGSEISVRLSAEELLKLLKDSANTDS